MENDTVTFAPAKTREDIQTIADLAYEIWNQHFVPIIGQAQVDYMLEKFQSVPALSAQIENEGYEYFLIQAEGKNAGYTGVRQEEGALFLSKLYVHPDFRGRHLATQTLQFLADLCRERQLKKIWLTCNKYNADTLAIYDHLGFVRTGAQVTDIGEGFVMDDYVLTYTIS